MITDVELKCQWHRRALSIYPNAGRAEIPLASCLTAEIADAIVNDHNAAIVLPNDTSVSG